nr:lysine 2,3-aminomutase [Candidatus Woesebacteria bacterium]
MDKNDFIFSLPQLKEYLREKKYDLDKVQLFEAQERHHFYMLIPKFYLDLIDWYDLDDPLRNMVVTSNLEEKIYEYELKDPIGDLTHEPVPGIIHRYPDRCLLMLTNVCAVHCRFCFRKNLLDTNKADYEKALSYIREHEELREVIL